MLRLELVSNTQEEVIYNYFPEHESEYGTVSINKATGELDVKKVSVNDEYKRYLYHAISTVEMYFKEDSFREKATVAWC